MPSEVEAAGPGSRRIGALAGVAPASIAVGLLVVVGAATPTREFIVAAVGIPVLAVVIGGLVEPLARGSFRADLMALVAYALVGAMAYLLLGSVGMAWTELATGGASDLGAAAQVAAARLLYGMLYLPFWAAFVAPFALAWAVAIRFLRRRQRPGQIELVGSDETQRPIQARTTRSRRMALASAAIILGYGLFVAVLPLFLYDRDPKPPWYLDRPVALFGLFAVPAVVAAIGAVRGVRPILIAAGVICLLQAYIAFSAVTVGFVVPAIALLWNGAAESRPAQVQPNRAALFAGVAVIVLTAAAWVSLFAMTEPRCWVGVPDAGGTMIAVEVSANSGTFDGQTSIPSGGSGCSSAELTVQGMGVSATLAIGAIALAATAAFGGRRSDPT